MGPEIVELIEIGLCLLVIILLIIGFWFCGEYCLTTEDRKHMEEEFSKK